MPKREVPTDRAHIGAPVGTSTSNGRGSGGRRLTLPPGTSLTLPTVWETVSGVLEGGRFGEVPVQTVDQLHDHVLRRRVPGLLPRRQPTQPAAALRHHQPEPRLGQHQRVAVGQEPQPGRADPQPLLRLARRRHSRRLGTEAEVRFGQRRDHEPCPGELPSRHRRLLDRLDRWHRARRLVGDEAVQAVRPARDAVVADHHFHAHVRHRRRSADCDDSPWSGVRLPVGVPRRDRCARCSVHPAHARSWRAPVAPDADLGASRCSRSTAGISAT